MARVALTASLLAAVLARPAAAWRIGSGALDRWLEEVGGDAASDEEEGEHSSVDGDAAADERAAGRAARGRPRKSAAGKVGRLRLDDDDGDDAWSDRKADAAAAGAGLVLGDDEFDLLVEAEEDDFEDLFADDDESEAERTMRLSKSFVERASHGRLSQAYGYMRPRHEEWKSVHMQVSCEGMTVTCELTLNCNPVACTKQSGTGSHFTVDKRRASTFLRSAVFAWKSDDADKCRIHETPAGDTSCIDKFFPMPPSYDEAAPKAVGGDGDGAAAAADKAEVATPAERPTAMPVVEAVPVLEGAAS